MHNPLLREINKLVKTGKSNLQIYAEIAHKLSMNSLDIMYLIKFQRGRVDGTMRVRN